MVALLLGRRASLLDLQNQTIIWSTKLGSQGQQTWGEISENRVIIVRDSIVSLLDKSQGEIISQRYFSRPNAIAIVNDILITEQNGSFIGYGSGDKFQERLQNQIRENPNDFRH